jgi:hypothetical protein
VAAHSDPRPGGAGGHGVVFLIEFF